MTSTDPADRPHTGQPADLPADLGDSPRVPAGLSDADATDADGTAAYDSSLSDPEAQAAAGYDPEFLAVRVPLPGSGGREVRDLPYVHFSVLLDPARRLPALTAVNIDGADPVDLERGDDWHLDERIPESEQAGPEIYARNDLDRGHQVRRRDPVWGEPSVASRANLDTFTYTNCAPQAAEFNQSKELWLGLEDQVLTYADAHRLRVSVFTGPVLQPDDAPYRGIRIPRLFYKIVVWAVDRGAALRAAGYVLDQSPQLDGIDLEAAFAQTHEAGDPPPLGPYRTFQVPIRDIAELTRLELAQLAAVDSLQTVPTVQPPDGVRFGWVPLTENDQLTF
ncbi:DNA/RNA non-specific endonuclease [Frigoribacterium sp. 2-23]|uniref:DNA/RNA non-specific endonuclease n=1 Tax=Frigoribacterium sp. 2-23 TaxID=3415006 RepID=UPI003C6EB190